MKLEFETKRLFIREYSKKDLDAFIRVTSQLSVRATTYGIPDDYTKSYAKKWFKYLKKSMRDMEGYEFGMFLKDSGEYIGNVGLINVSMIHNHAMHQRQDMKCSDSDLNVWDLRRYQVFV